MSNLFTRHYYDTDNSKLFDKSNKDINSYTMDETTHESNSVCYGSFLNAQSQVARPQTKEGMFDLGTKVDIETKLQNRHVELNSMDRNNKDYEKIDVKVPNQCNLKEMMLNEDSRFTNPIVNYREMYTIDYSFTPYLIINPQDPVVNNATFLPPTRNGDSSRLSAKKDKYDLKPKEFATIKPRFDYVKESGGFLPMKTAIASPWA